MSAINGIFRRDGRDVNLHEINNMNDNLAHRGPDGIGTWCEGSVAFGHLMLHTTPESLHEILPFEDEKSGLVITADARIDNRQELSRELNLDDREDVPDNMFILKAYEKWGKNCPKYLLGDFSFVIWDKNEEMLFCARDHMGVKPFYYHLSDRAFFFATEIEPLVNIDKINIEINQVKIADYLLNMFEDRENTFYEGIFRLPAAYTLLVSCKSHQLDRYWSLDPTLRTELSSDEEYSEKLLSIFTEAVNCRLRSAFSIGSELSGGLDSSSISCVAQKNLSKEKKRLKTFSLYYSEFPTCDEKNYIDIASDGCNLDSYFLDGGGIDPFDAYDGNKWPKYEPTWAHSMHMYMGLYEMAQNQGIRILLSGYDGDSTLGADANYFSDLLKKKKLRTLLTEIKGYSKIHGTKTYLLFYFAIAPLIGSILPKFIKKIYGFFFYNERSEDITSLANKLIKSNFAEKVDISKRNKIYSEYYENKARSAREWHYHHLMSGLFQHILELLDKFGAKYSIEYRFPFLDRRLLEYCLSVPSEQKMKNGRDRIFMRRATKNILPEEIRQRYNKAGTDNVLNVNFQRFGGKKLEKFVYEKDSPINEYIDFQILEKIYESFKLNAYKEEYLASAQFILGSLYVLDKWLKSEKVISNLNNE